MSDRDGAESGPVPRVLPPGTPSQQERDHQEAGRRQACFACNTRQEVLAAAGDAMAAVSLGGPSSTADVRTPFLADEESVCQQEPFDSAVEAAELMASPASTHESAYPAQHEPAPRADESADSASSSTERRTSNAKHGVLYVEAFQSFEPLLTASQDYARLSGCRFRGSDFRAALAPTSGAGTREPDPRGDGLEERCGASADDDPFLAAKCRAALAVRRFAERLRGGEVALVEEIERAFRLVMVESVRNAMIGSFQRLELWPPAFLPLAVDSDDCSYEDVSASLPEIAQRLYNDETRRQRHLIGIGGLCRLRQRAMTAAFLIDFASEVPLPLPQMPATQDMMLKDFQARVAEWDARGMAPGRLSQDASFDGSFRGRLRESAANAKEASHAAALFAARAAMVPFLDVLFFTGLPLITRSSAASFATNQQQRRPFDSDLAAAATAWGGT